MPVFLACIVLMIGLAVFLAMLVATWRHRSHVTTPAKPRAVVEYLWALVPWILMALSAAPALRRIFTGG